MKVALDILQSADNWSRVQGSPGLSNMADKAGCKRGRLASASKPCGGCAPSVAKRNVNANKAADR